MDGDDGHRAPSDRPRKRAYGERRSSNTPSFRLHSLSKDSISTRQRTPGPVALRTTPMLTDPSRLPTARRASPEPANFSRPSSRSIDDGMDHRRPARTSRVNSTRPSGEISATIVDLTTDTPSPSPPPEREPSRNTEPLRPPRLDARVRSLRQLTSNQTLAGSDTPPVIDLEAPPEPPNRPLNSHPNNHRTSNYVHASVQADFPENDEIEITNWRRLDPPTPADPPEEPGNDGVGVGSTLNRVRSRGRAATQSDATRWLISRSNSRRPRRDLADWIISRHQARTHRGDTVGSIRDIPARVRQYLRPTSITAPSTNAPPSFPMNLFDFQSVGFQMDGANVPNVFEANAQPPPNVVHPQDTLPPVPPTREGYTRDVNEESTLECPNCETELGADGEGENGLVFVARACGHVYCGVCADIKNRSVSAAKKGKGKAMTSGGKTVMSLATCVVPGCYTRLHTPKSMFALYL